MRPNVTPSNTQRDVKNKKPFTFQAWPNGIIQDAAPTAIRGALSDGLNVTVMNAEIQGRTGSTLFTSLTFPLISGRTFVASKTGAVVTAPTGTFTLADVGNSIYYQSGSQQYDLITAYTDSATVTVEDSNAQGTNINCGIRGGINAAGWHKVMQKFVFMIGSAFYIADNAITAFTAVPVISLDLPFNTKSDFACYKTYALIFNGNGIYKIDLADSFPVAYRINVSAPLKTIVDSVATTTHTYNYLVSATRLKTQGYVDRQSQGVVIDAETGTTLPGSDDIDNAVICPLLPISATAPTLISGLSMPSDAGSAAGTQQWHFTHYSIWRTMDLNSPNPADTSKTTFNDPNTYIWVADVRMCGAFIGSASGNTYTASQGQFGPEDVGSSITFENGQVRNILTVDTTGSIITFDSLGINATDQAACIGGGRVIHGTVAENVLTANASVFTSADVRKTIFNGNGYRYIILSVSADGTQATLDSTAGTQIEQGFTLDPTGRNFNDTISDDTLEARVDFYTAYGRFMQPMPNCNMGVVIPGFVIAAQRLQPYVYYAGIDDAVSQLIGQYVPIQMTDQTHDAVTAFVPFANVLAVICAMSTWSFTIGVSTLQVLQGSSEEVAILTLNQVDPTIGCLDYGSIQTIGNGLSIMITNEPGGEALRTFNGSAYSTQDNLQDPNYGGRIANALQNTKRLSASIYDGNLGYLIWRKTSS
jgi:hypothetical protein